MRKHARAVNRLDAQAVAACFHPDAWEDHGVYRGPAGPFAERFTPGTFNSFESMFHHIGNQLTELDGDRALNEAYFGGWHRYEEEGKPKDLLFGGRYLAIFERRNGRPWLIADRTVVHDWSRVDTVDEAWPPNEHFWPGRFSMNDLVYRLLKEGREKRPAVVG